MCSQARPPPSSQSTKDHTRQRFYCVNLTELVFMLQRSGCRVCFPILPKGSCWSVELGRAMQLPMLSLPKIVHRHACFVCAPGPNRAPAKKAHPSPRGIEPAPPSTSGSDTAAGAGSFQGLGRYLRLQPPSLRALRQEQNQGKQQSAKARPARGALLVALQSLAVYVAKLSQVSCSQTFGTSLRFAPGQGCQRGRARPRPSSVSCVCCLRRRCSTLAETKLWLCGSCDRPLPRCSSDASCELSDSAGAESWKG